MNPFLTGALYALGGLAVLAYVGVALIFTRTRTVFGNAISMVMMLVGCAATAAYTGYLSHPAFQKALGAAVVLCILTLGVAGYQRRRWDLP